jgi:hypothetical protein
VSLDERDETAAGDLLAAALDYAAAGMPVLPLDGKVPRNRGGLTNASADVAQVAEWWRRWQDANVGVVTGAASGYVVLDVDVPAGLRSLAELERRHGKLSTAQVLTGSGGRHYWFCAPAEELRNSAGALGEGLDVRGAGGYVVAPPSVHENGNPYRWTRELEHAADCPAWLLADAQKRRNGKAPALEAVIPEGARDATLASLAGTMRRRGMGEAAILAALRVENERCRPPLGESDLERIAASVARYEPKAEAELVPLRAQAWGAFRDEAAADLGFLVDGLWPEPALGFIAARPKAGKTWVALALAVCIATGRPLFGEYAIAEPRSVLYIALEGARAGLRARIAAIARGLGIDPDGDELERLHLLYKPRPFNLADPRLAALVIEEARRLDAAIVFIDVLRQAVRGLKESAAEDFAQVRDALEPLLDERRSAALLHHFGKLNETQKERTPGERMVGSGAMEGALDVAFYITKSEAGARRLRIEFEARDFATPDLIGVALVGTGSGEHGGFTYVDAASFVLDATAAEDRDLAGELEELFADGAWRTVKEAAAKKGGIGANADEVRATLGGNPERFVQVPGRHVGRHASARPWGTKKMLEQVTSPPSHPESPTPISGLSPHAEQVTPRRGVHPSHLLSDDGEGDSARRVTRSVVA